MLKTEKAFATLGVAEMMETEGGAVGAAGNLMNVALIVAGIIKEVDPPNWPLHKQGGCPQYHECALGMPEDCPFH